MLNSRRKMCDKDIFWVYLLPEIYSPVYISLQISCCNKLTYGPQKGVVTFVISVVKCEMLLAMTRNRKSFTERAKGILMEERNINESEAFSLIRKSSMDKRISMKEIAEAIILSYEIRQIK